MQKITKKPGPLVGQNHPRAKCTDHDVELCRRLYEEHPVGHPSHLGYRQLARIFDVDRATIRDWIKYRFR